jgi:hypothetical protein
VNSSGLIPGMDWEILLHRPTQTGSGTNSASGIPLVATSVLEWALHRLAELKWKMGGTFLQQLLVYIILAKIILPLRLFLSTFSSTVHSAKQGQKSCG